MEYNNIVKENDDWQRNFIEKLLKIKEGCLIAENKNIRYFSLNKGVFYIYEDDYKFEVCFINMNSIKIDKFFKGSDIEIMKTVTKEKMIKKYGISEGTEKWNSYCKKQADSNKFEYKHEKYWKE